MKKNGWWVGKQLLSEMDSFSLNCQIVSYKSEGKFSVLFWAQSHLNEVNDDTLALHQQLMSQLWHHFLSSDLHTTASWIHSVWIYWTLFWGEGELSLTQLPPVCGRGNPLLSGTQAAPVQHCFTQNASVRLCSGARQRGATADEKSSYTHMCRHTTGTSPLFAIYPAFILSVIW